MDEYQELKPKVPENSYSKNNNNSKNSQNIRIVDFEDNLNIYKR